MWDLVGNPEDRFSQNEAQLLMMSVSVVFPTFVFTGNILFSFGS